ncbi:probable medium-chain specific acyl-dehydrogenase, mitochondrial, partial [Paramuricea clavata]
MAARSLLPLRRFNRLLTNTHVGAVPIFQGKCYGTKSENTSGYSFDMSEELRALRDMARKFSREEILPVAAEHDRTGEYPWEIIKKAHGLGLLNTHVPEEY